MCGCIDGVLGWIEHHPGLASWLQAVGSIAGIAIAIAVPATIENRRLRQEQVDRAAKTLGWAIMFVGNLVEFRTRLQVAINDHSVTPVSLPHTTAVIGHGLWEMGEVGENLTTVLSLMTQHLEISNTVSRGDYPPGTLEEIRAQMRSIAISAAEYCDIALEQIANLRGMPREIGDRARKAVGG